MKLIKKLKKAYTLVELVVTIAVIAILAAVAVGAYFGITNSATISRLEQEARQAYTNVQLVGSEGDKNHKLNTNGIYIDDLDYFEERYNSMSSDSFYITEGNVDPTVVYGYTLYFFNKTESNLSYYHKVDTNYNYFAYYNPSILTKRALVDIITGKIYVEDFNFTVENYIDDNSTEQTTDPITQVPIEPEEIKFQELVVYKSSYKYQYFEGEYIDLTGLTFYEKYTNGDISTEAIPHTSLTYSKDPLTKDITNFEFSYSKDGVTSTVGIDILVREIVLDNLLIEGTLIKTNYVVGQDIDLRGLTFIALYNNGNRENVEVTYNPTLALGQTEVSVSYQGITKVVTGFTVEAIKPVELLVSGTLNKTSYFEGENIDLTGLTFTVKNNDNSTFEVTNLSEINSPSLNYGDTSVEFTYTSGEITLEATISGIEVIEIKPAELLVSDITENLYEGTSLDEIKQCFTYKVKYSNEDQYRDLTHNDITASFKGENQEPKGNKIIVFTYTDSELNKSISIEKPISFIDVVSLSLTPSSTTLIAKQYEGSKLDLTGITFNAKFNNGVEREVEVETPTLSLGQTSATVTYDGLSYTFNDIEVLKSGFYFVDDLNDLEVGDSIIVTSEKTYNRTLAFKEEWESGETFQHPTNDAFVTYENKMINYSDNYIIFTLEKGLTEGTFALKTIYGYLTYSAIEEPFNIEFLPEKTNAGSWSFRYENLGFSDSNSHLITTSYNDSTYYYTFHYDGSSIFFGGNKSKDYDVFLYKLQGNTVPVM